MDKAKKIGMILAMVAVGLLIYNKVPAVKKALGGV